MLSNTRFSTREVKSQSNAASSFLIDFLRTESQGHRINCFNIIAGDSYHLGQWEIGLKAMGGDRQLVLRCRTESYILSQGNSRNRLTAL